MHRDQAQLKPVLTAVYLLRRGATFGNLCCSGSSSPRMENDGAVTDQYRFAGWTLANAHDSKLNLSCIDSAITCNPDLLKYNYVAPALPFLQNVVLGSADSANKILPLCRPEAVFASRSSTNSQMRPL